MRFHASLQRPEGVIAVVSHSGFLRCTSRQFAHNAAPIVKDELHRWCATPMLLRYFADLDGAD